MTSSSLRRRVEAILFSSLVLSPLALANVAHDRRYHNAHLHRRSNIVDGGSPIADSYDYVIAGGGQAGLVLAARLSEDQNTTVLVLEAGKSGDEVYKQMGHPGNTYFDSLTRTEYDYAYSTTPQAGANDRSIFWPRGKVLGGSSAINGLYYINPTKRDLDTWKGLIDGGDEDERLSSEYWGWDSFYEALRKSQGFVPPSAEIKQQAGIEYNANSMGSGGNVQLSYPGYSFNVIGDWVPTLENIGIPSNTDAYAGDNHGAFVATSNINPTNWTRSFSRPAYIDNSPTRQNLDVLPGATVTRLVFDSNTSAGNLTATAVEYAAYAGGPTQRIKVNREVILAGGVIGSPQMLMVSGVGPRDVLEAAGIEVLHELPGVGAHLQDHMAAGVAFDTDIETAQSIKESGSEFSNSDIFLSFVNSATAYVRLTDLLGDYADTFAANARSTLSSAVSALATTSDEVRTGYERLYNAIVDELYIGGESQVELLLTMAIPGKIIVQAALQHPLSMGRVTLKSPSAFDAPNIDPNYLQQEADIILLREGLKLARKAGNTAPLSNVLTREDWPGSRATTDAEWDSWLKDQIATEYHPSGTCAMLPRTQGGVVNARLQVYGLANVRVADASVFPLSMTTHLGAPVYGLAEQAATMLRAYYNADEQQDPPAGDNGNAGNGNGNGGNGGGNGGGGTSGGDSNPEGAATRSVATFGSLLIAVLSSVLLL